MNGFYLTLKGQEYLAKSMESGKPLVFTKGEFGNGVLPEGALPVSATELISKLGPLPISKYTAEGNQFTIETQFSNRVNGSLLPAFHLTELGIFGKIQGDTNYPETLMVYAVTTEDKSDYIENTLNEFIINFPIKVNANAELVVEIDESMVYYTKAEADGKFMSKEDIANDYLTKEDANNTFAKKEDAKSVLVTHTIPASGWSNGLYAFNDENIKRDTQPIEMLKGDSMTTEQLEIAQAANIQHETQIAGKVIMRAHGDTPTVDLPVKFLIRGDL